MGKSGSEASPRGVSLQGDPADFFALGAWNSQG